MYLENCIQILKRLKVVSCNEARNKFLAYVDFANANIFPDKPFRKQVFQRLTENLNADKI